MAARKAASVLPEPVGAAISVGRPALIAAQASVCAGVGAGKARANHAATAGWKSPSWSAAPRSLSSRANPRDGRAARAAVFRSADAVGGAMNLSRGSREAAEQNENLPYSEREGNPTGLPIRVGRPEGGRRAALRGGIDIFLPSRPFRTILLERGKKSPCARGFGMGVGDRVGKRERPGKTKNLAEND